MKPFTAILRALHPDTNGGDHSRTEEFQRVLREHRIHNQVCACGCGKLVDPARMRLNPKTKLAGQFCKGRFVGNLRRKPRKLAVVMVSLLITIGIQAQTNTAAFNAGMASARAQVIALTTPSQSDNINPMLAGLSSATNGTVSAAQMSPLPAGSSVSLGNFIYPTNMMSFSWTLQASVDLQTWSNLMTWPRGLRSGGTLTLTNTGPKAFYRLVGH